MSVSRPHAQRLRWQGILRKTLIFGAVYDFVFAALMVVAPDLPERLLSLPQPGEDYYLWIMAVFLLMLGTLYWVAARDPERFAPIVWVAIVGRTLGFVVFVVAALRDPALSGLYVLAICDLLIALSHAVAWRFAFD